MQASAPARIIAGIASLMICLAVFQCVACIGLPREQNEPLTLASAH